ncbi:MAG: hypothetical protein FWD01_01705 [Defluviitaleaceae bacterium]|nr:hypothetical protein [Defluviitaleaceae bacterium]
MDIDETKNRIEFTPRPPRYERNEKRMHYGGGNKAPKSRRGFRERSILQATVCGGILAIFLLLSILNNSFTNTAIDWIGRNISYNMIEDADSPVYGWIQNITEFFGEEMPQESLENYEFPETPQTFETPETQQNLPALHELPQSTTTYDLIPYDRIDEELLREIITRPDLYYQNNGDNNNE